MTLGFGAPSSESLGALGSRAGSPVYLTAEQVAALLQVSDKSVYRWLKADPTMPALKIGGTVRFPRERLERWLRERQQGAPRMRRLVHWVGKSAERQEAARG